LLYYTDNTVEVVMRTTIGLVGLLALGACSGSDAATGVSGPAGTRTYAVSAFDAVSLAGSDNVRVVRGPAASVSASGPAKELDRLDIRVDGSTLKIGRKRESWGMNWSGGPGVTVTVTTPGINRAAIGGSGDMTIDKVSGERFEGSIGGSGDLELADAQVTRAELSLAGSGNIRIAGRATNAEMSIAGSGDIAAERLASQTAEISVAGSGNVRAAATGKAKISLVGSGDVTVKGTKDCEVSKIGSGEARCEP
jgi:Putative auto-transporter adhesin, head GIN domain